MPRIFRRKKTSTRKPKTNRRRNLRPKGDFKKKVLSVIHSQVENKEVLRENPGTYFNSGIDSVGDVNLLTPLIAQGTDDGQRIGSEVRVQSMNIKGHIIMSQSVTTASASRIGVRVMVITPKRFTFGYDAQVNALTWLPKLLKVGSTERGFTGIPGDLYCPLNSDIVTKHYDKVFMMNSPYIATAVGAVPVNTNSTKFFNIKLRCKNKKLTFDEVSNNPYGYTPIMLIGYCHLDGASPDIATTQLFTNWNTFLRYEDA